jgi:subtilisin
MNKKLVTLIIIFTIILSFSIPVGATADRKSVIVVFKNAHDAGLIRAHGGEIKYQYDIFPAIAVNMPTAALNGLRNNPNVAYIEDDIKVYALGEVLPWGVDRIDADKVWGSGGIAQTDTGANTGVGVSIAVIDTGIDADHPDLSANVKGGINFVSSVRLKPANPSRWDDDNGHGTHVAGTIAAVDNEIGVIGVAPQAYLYGVKVLDRSGSGYLSDVLAGINWARNNNMDIITMSLGSSEGTQTMEDACDNAYNAGVVIVAAAGNDNGGRVIYPAAYDSVIAVSATDSSDNLASYSNVGLEIEMAAPGSGIYSTYKGGIYATMSGTSMATPHVTGVAALVIASNLTKYQNNPGAVRWQLTSTAEDLGTNGWDASFGFGLVDAENAAPPVTSIPDDTTPPAISDVATSDITDTSATITWNTDETSDSKVNYGISTALGTFESDSAMVSSHSVTLTGLAPETLYHYEVGSTDSSGNLATDDNTGGYYTFNTTTSSPPPADNEMHIDDITINSDSRTAGRNIFTWAIADVTIVDSSNTPVPGAQVTGTWSGLTIDSDVATTGSDGIVTVLSDSVKIASGTYTFTVNDVLLSGWNYNALLNTENANSIKI